jgi:hypothetical protein
MKIELLILTILFYLITSCADDKKTNHTEPITKVPSNTNYQVYIDRFAEEAAKRDVEVDLEGLNLIISDTLNYYCGYGFPNIKTVQISDRSECWAQLIESDKEILMFHELGHTLLNRQHDNEKLPNNDFKSMMKEGSSFGVYSDYTPERRTYYLNELFDSNTQKPIWASTKVNPLIIVNDSINFNTENWEYSHNGKSKHCGNISTRFFSSPGSSLKISTTEPSGFSSWKYELNPKGLKHGSRLVMEVNIKLENVTNDGVAIAIRGVSNEDMIFIGSTEGVKTINGTSPFVKYTVEVPYYIEKAKKVELFLLLHNNATGTVYFDDIKLINYE